MISLLALLFSLTGVLLTSQVLGFLRPTEFKPEDVVFWVIDGGSASTNYAEESRERDVAMIHGIWSTRWGRFSFSSQSFFNSLLLSMVETKC